MPKNQRMAEIHEKLVMGVEGGLLGMYYNFREFPQSTLNCHLTSIFIITHLY